MSKVIFQNTMTIQMRVLLIIQEKKNQLLIKMAKNKVEGRKHFLYLLIQHLLIN